MEVCAWTTGSCMTHDTTHRPLLDCVCLKREKVLLVSHPYSQLVMLTRYVSPTASLEMQLPWHIAQLTEGNSLTNLGPLTIYPICQCGEYGPISGILLKCLCLIY